MKQSKFIEGVFVRLEKQPVYSMVSPQAKNFLRLILPLFNADYLSLTPGLLLAANGSPVTISEVAITAGQSPEETLAHLNELARHGFMLRDHKTGAIECPVAGEVIKRHILAVEAGKLGGNPALKRKDGKVQSPKVSPKPKSQPKAKAKSKSKRWPVKKAVLKAFNSTVAFTLPKETSLESMPHLKDKVALNSIVLEHKSDDESTQTEGNDLLIITIEGIINGSKVSLKGELRHQHGTQAISPRGELIAQPLDNSNLSREPAYPTSLISTKLNLKTNHFDGAQIVENNELAGNCRTVSSNITCNTPLTTSLSDRLDNTQGGQVDDDEAGRVEASRAYARHVRGSQGFRKEPILSNYNTLTVLEPYVSEYNCEKNFSRSLCEPGGAGGQISRPLSRPLTTDDDQPIPDVTRPTYTYAHETEPATNSGSLSANRPEQLSSRGLDLDGGTLPTANRTERTPVDEMSFSTAGRFPTQTPLTSEPSTTKPRPTAPVPVPRFEHTLTSDPDQEGSDASSKKPFVLKVLPIPNPFSSHPDVAKGDPALAQSLLNGGLSPTKTPSQTTHNRTHEETTPPSCAPPPPPFSPVQPAQPDSDESTTARHAPAQSDFTGQPDIDDFDPSELYDDDTPIEDFDLSDRAEMTEPDNSDFAPIFDPPKIERLKTAPEAIPEAESSPVMQFDAPPFENAPAVFSAPAMSASVLNDNPELKLLSVKAEEIQKPEKENPEPVSVASVPAPDVLPSGDLLPDLEVAEVAEVVESIAPVSVEKPKRARKEKTARTKKTKTDDPNDPAQAAYLANYHRMMDFYRDKIKAKIPNYAAQGQAVKWLLVQGEYTPEECEACLLDQFENWTKGSPSWLTVKSHIAAWKLRKENPVQPKPVPRPQRQFYSNGDERRNNRIPTATQQLNEIVKAVDTVTVDLSDPNFVVPVAAAAAETVVPCSVPNIDACLNMLKKFHTMAIHLKKTGGMPIGIKLNHVGADWVYSQCKFPLDIETLSFEEIEKRFRQHHARLVTALTKQTKAGNIGNGNRTTTQSTQATQTTSSLPKNSNPTHKGA